MEFERSKNNLGCHKIEMIKLIIVKMNIILITIPVIIQIMKNGRVPKNLKLVLI